MSSCSRGMQGGLSACGSLIDGSPSSDEKLCTLHGAPKAGGMQRRGPMPPGAHRSGTLAPRQLARGRGTEAWVGACSEKEVCQISLIGTDGRMQRRGTARVRKCQARSSMHEKAGAAFGTCQCSRV